MFYDWGMELWLQLGGLLSWTAMFCVLLPLWLRQRPLWAPINTPELFAADIFSLVWRKCFPQGPWSSSVKSHLQRNFWPLGRIPLLWYQQVSCQPRRRRGNTDSSPPLPPPPPWRLGAAPQSSTTDDFKIRALSAAATGSLGTAVAAMQPIITLPLLLSAPLAAAALHLKADDGGTSVAVIDAERRRPRLTICEEAKLWRRLIGPSWRRWERRWRHSGGDVGSPAVKASRETSGLNCGGSHFSLITVQHLITNDQFRIIQLKYYVHWDLRSLVLVLYKVLLQVLFFWGKSNQWFLQIRLWKHMAPILEA